MAAVERAIELKLPEVTIYYDYMGIEMWAEGAWKRNRQGTIAYYEYMQSAKNKIRIKFVKVKGHSGVAMKKQTTLQRKRSEIQFRNIFKQIIDKKVV